MNTLIILKLLVVIATVATGAAGLFWPRKIQGFIGLETPGGRGVTELRAIFGGTFIGLGLAVLLINAPETYRMLGLVYATIGAIRAISMVTDKSVEQSNIISLAAEIVFAILLLL